MRRLLVLGLAAALLAGACSGDDDDEHPVVTVTVSDNTFTPAVLEIEPGTTVRWVNEGQNEHDIHPVDPTQEFKAHGFFPGDVYEYTFEEPGVYDYWCTFHGTEHAGMVGTIVVRDAGDESPTTPVTSAPSTATTRHVPEEYPTIQAAVDGSSPGDLVLVAPGLYAESVTVTKADLVIRGLERNTTILDGRFQLENGIEVLADGVAIENLTARNFTENGFYWTGVTGYRGSYLTAIRNGGYGIYAFGSTSGLFEHSYAAGNPDAGFYIGDCDPCNAVVSDVVAEWNGIGFSGTNAGGDLYVVNSVWRDNWAGIVPNSSTGEPDPPQHGITIAGNRVYGNHNDAAAAAELAPDAFGNGIVIAGGSENLVTHNLVYDHDGAGIAILPWPETVLDPANEAAVDFDARDNIVRANTLHDNRVADLVLVTTLADAADDGANCFAANEYATSIPATLPECDGPASAFRADTGLFDRLLRGARAAPDYVAVFLPDASHEANLPDAETAPTGPAGPVAVDVDGIVTPSETNE